MSHLSAESHSHHVHFDSASLKDEFETDNSSVTYQRADDGIIVSLGFLQVKHRYLIDLKLPSTFFGNVEENTRFVPNVAGVPNLNCRITDFTGLTKDRNDYYEMKIEFFAYKEKLMRETLSIVDSKDSKEMLKLIISARVLGKGKGTPMLRTGIHCIGSEKDDESEASDFSFTK